MRELSPTWRFILYALLVGLIAFALMSMASAAHGQTPVKRPARPSSFELFGGQPIVAHSALGGHNPDSANDGNNTTWYQANGCASGVEYLIIDASYQIVLDYIYLQQYDVHIASDVNIYWSTDGTTWTYLITSDTLTGDDIIGLPGFESTAWRYWKISVNTPGASCAKWGVYTIEGWGLRLATSTPTPTPTFTLTFTRTRTPTYTQTPTITNTPANTGTPTPTYTPVSIIGQACWGTLTPTPTGIDCGWDACHPCATLGIPRVQENTVGYSLAVLIMFGALFMFVRPTERLIYVLLLIFALSVYLITHEAGVLMLWVILSALLGLFANMTRIAGHK